MNKRVKIKRRVEIDFNTERLKEAEQRITELETMTQHLLSEIMKLKGRNNKTTPNTRPNALIADLDFTDVSTNGYSISLSDPNIEPIVTSGFEFRTNLNTEPLDLHEGSPLPVEIGNPNQIDIPLYVSNRIIRHCRYAQQDHHNVTVYNSTQAERLYMNVYKRPTKVVVIVYDVIFGNDTEDIIDNEIEPSA